MTTSPGRTPKYRTADDLLDNTTVRNDCLVWPEANLPVPSLSPASPMSVKFYTNSVARILFTICRYPPGGTRLVRLCTTHFCVNPFHHAEPKRFAKQRKEMLNPHGLLPSQESTRALIAPPDDYIASVYPRKPQHVRFLAETAARAGLDGKGLRPSERKVWGFPAPNDPALANATVVYADPAKPLFKLKSRAPAPAPAEPVDAGPTLTPELEASFKELTAALEPTHVPIDQGKHPNDFGRNPETNRPLTLRQMLDRMGK